MTQKKTYMYNGQPVDGQPINVESANEPWAQYTLEDGTTVKVKIVLLEVVRLKAHNEVTGDPIYQFQFQQIIGTVSPDSMKRKPQ